MANSASNVSRKALVIFVAGVVAAGLLLGYSNRPEGWYAALHKPFFNPPN